MLQDQSIEAYNIYQKLSKEQKEDVLQEQFEVDNDMGSDGDGDIETSRENINILLEDAKNGKKYAKGGGVAMGIKKGDLVFAKHEGTRGLIGLVLTNPKKDIYGETVVKVYFRGYRGDILETSVRDIVEIVKGEYVFRAIENGDILAYLSIANKNKYYINDIYENLEMDEYANGGGIERPFTKDKVFKKDNISVQRVGGSDMWEVAINGKPMGRVLGAQTFEYAIKKAEKEFKNKYANGGGVGNFSEYSNDALTDAIINLSRFENTEDDIQTLKEELKKRKESIKVDSIEEMVKSNLFNGEISCEKLTEIIGCKPNYPYQIVGAIKLEKCYLRPYYKLV
jgi:hypothetical protein